MGASLAGMQGPGFAISTVRNKTKGITCQSDPHCLHLELRLMMVPFIQDIRPGLRRWLGGGGVKSTCKASVMT